MKKYYFWFIYPITKWILLAPIFLRHFLNIDNTYLNNYVTLYAWALFIWVIFQSFVLMAKPDDVNKVDQQTLRNFQYRMSRPKFLTKIFGWIHFPIVLALALIGEWMLFIWWIVYSAEIGYGNAWCLKMWKQYKKEKASKAQAIMKNFNTKEVEDADFTEAE